MSRSRLFTQFSSARTNCLPLNFAMIGHELYPMHVYLSHLLYLKDSYLMPLILENRFLYLQN